MCKTRFTFPCRTDGVCNIYRSDVDEMKGDSEVSVSTHLPLTSAGEDEEVLCSTCPNISKCTDDIDITSCSASRLHRALTSPRCFFKEDIEERSFEHVMFLRGMHRLGLSTHRASLESFRRYADLWLPLVAKVYKGEMDLDRDTLLVPPADIAWIWHCHRLAPKHYLEHTRSTFSISGYLEARPPFQFQEKGLGEECDLNVPSMSSTRVMTAAAPNIDLVKRQTREIWQKLFPGESFFIADGINSLDSASPVDKSYKSSFSEGEILEKTRGILSGYNILDSGERQSAFLWQVSQARFFYQAFLRDGVANYTRFLFLRSDGEKQVIVPTYQIDLMWHTHILSSLEAYEVETCRVMGHMLNHDDSLNDRSAGSSLEVAFKSTCQLWLSKYGSQYFCPGGMYR